MNTMDSWKKRCNFCGEEFAYSARRCPYCGSLAGQRLYNTGPAEQNGGLNNIHSDNTDTVINGEADEAAADNRQGSISKPAFYHTDMGQIQPEQSGAAGQDTVQQVDSAAGGAARFDAQETSDGAFSSRATVQNYSRYKANTQVDSPLGNGMKVFLTVISTIPWIGQLIGIIAAILFINSDYDRDRKSFGTALMISSLILFVLISCIGLLLAMAVS